MTLSGVFGAPGVIRDGVFATLNLCQTTDVQDMLTFCEEPAYLDAVNANPAVTCVLTTPELAGNFAERLGIAISPQPRLTFFKLHNRLVADGSMALEVKDHISPSASIHPTAYVATPCYIGDNVTIGPHAVVESYTHVSAGCVIDAGCVIGASGLEYKRDGENVLKVLHAGGVYLEEGVEVLANAVIGKDIFPSFTRIGKDTKISILVNIGHRATIGRRCFIAGNALVSGSCRLGDDVWVGPSATISNGVEVGDRAHIKLGSVVVKNVREGETVSGNFAVPHARHLRDYARSIAGK